jgi:hypothetical protein
MSLVLKRFSTLIPYIPLSAAAGIVMAVVLLFRNRSVIRPRER